MNLELRIGSIFSGIIGGLELGLERAGVGSVAWQCEIDPYARAVLAKHWPDAIRFEDVTNMHDVPPVDVICGGFPCQDISNAGKRVGIDGARSGLFFELMRVVCLVRPRFVVLENVAALLGRGMGDVLGELSESGYDAEWDCVPASAVGAPHRRDRIFILAYAARHVEGRSEQRAERERAWAGGESGDVADAVRDRRDGRTHEQERQSERGDSSDAWQGGAVADADQGGQSRRRQHDAGWGALVGTQRERGWLPEPDVGGTIDGFSSWLDSCALIGQSHERIVDYGNAAKTGPEEIVRDLRNRIDPNGVLGATRRFDCVPSEAVLLAYLRELSRHCEAGNASLASAEAAWSEMRSVRSNQKPSRAPHRPSPVKQRSGEHSDALQALSRLLALDAEAAWLDYRRSDACLARHWESGIARVLHGVPSRVDRLKCLGNAVVPQVAEVVGRRLMEIARQ